MLINWTGRFHFQLLMKSLFTISENDYFHEWLLQPRENELDHSLLLPLYIRKEGRKTGRRGPSIDKRTQPYIQLSSLDQALFWVVDITRSGVTQPHNRETISDPDLKYTWYQRFPSQVRLDASVSAGGRQIFGRSPKSRATGNCAWRSLAPSVDLQLFPSVS